VAEDLGRHSIVQGEEERRPTAPAVGADFAGNVGRVAPSDAAGLSPVASAAGPRRLRPEAARTVGRSYAPSIFKTVMSYYLCYIKIPTGCVRCRS